jgi:hypothetical protein
MILFHQSKRLLLAGLWGVIIHAAENSLTVKVTETSALHSRISFHGFFEILWCFSIISCCNRDVWNHELWIRNPVKSGVVSYFERGNEEGRGQAWVGCEGDDDLWQHSGAHEEDSVS